MKVVQYLRVFDSDEDCCGRESRDGLEKSHVKLHNKSDKPDNVVLNEHELVSRCEEIRRNSCRRLLRGLFSLSQGEMCCRGPGFAYLGDIRLLSVDI